MVQIELEKLTQGKVRMLSGHERGKEARLLFKLRRYESEDDQISVVAPENLDTVTPSFVQGLLGEGVATSGAELIDAKYDFSEMRVELIEDFEIGMRRLKSLSNAKKGKS